MYAATSEGPKGPVKRMMDWGVMFRSQAPMANLRTHDDAGGGLGVLLACGEGGLVG